MANELTLREATGQAARLRSLLWTADRAGLHTGAGVITAIESVADINFGNGGIVWVEKLTATGTGTGVYVATMPAVVAGDYLLDTYVGDAAPTPGETPKYEDTPLSWYQSAMMTAYKLRIQLAQQTTADLIYGLLDNEMGTILAALVALDAVLKADHVIDKTTTPTAWQLVLYERGTLTEIIRKRIKDIDGTAVVSTGTIIGQLVQ